MKLVGLLLVALLVSTDARFPKFGTLFGKIDIPSVAKKVMSKLPFRKPGTESATPYAEPSPTEKPSPAFCDSHDCPEFYEVKQDATSYTLRCYPKPYRWVSTSVTGNNYKQVGRTAFWRLFSYIKGNNEEGMKINMTVPVTMQIQPDTKPESFSKNDYTMSFFIPFKHQKDAPAPSAEDVQLTVVQPFCAYVRVFESRSNITKIEENYKALVEDLKSNGLGDDFRTDMIYSAGYNDPRSKKQHNEIWLVSKRQSPASLPENKKTQSMFGKYIGKIVDKMQSKDVDIPSMAKKIMSKLPCRKPGAESTTPYAEPSAKKSPPAFCDSHDCPEFYEVKQDATSYTLRCYPKPYRWVSTSVTGNNYKQVGRTAFWRLFSYIEGNNEEGMKINMTVPVTMQIQPDTKPESFSKNVYTMSFFIPFKHQKDAPAPSAEDVQLTVVQPFCAYVRVFESRSNITKIEENYKALVEDLKSNGLGDDFRTDMIYSAGYNDPRSKKQHNEIWIVSKRQSPAPLPEDAKTRSMFGKYIGKIVGKMQSKDIDIPSMTKKIMSKLPFRKPGAESPEPSSETAPSKSSPSFCSSYDCPKFYEVKLNATDYTLRCYPNQYRWVSTTVTGEDPKQAGKTAFWRLFRYIGGRNAKKMKIKMTVPVAMQIQPDPESESFCKNNYTMSFFIPFKHQKDAPAPSEDTVHLSVFQPFCAYVRVYGGYSNMKMVEKHYNELVKSLNRDGLGEEDFRTDAIYSAGYDGPWKFLFRHNEIWLISKNQSPIQREIETL